MKGNYFEKTKVIYFLKLFFSTYPIVIAVRHTGSRSRRQQEHMQKWKVTSDCFVYFLISKLFFSVVTVVRPTEDEITVNSVLDCW